MANTYTQNLGLLKPGINDPASTNLWGGFLNSDFDLIDSAISGYFTLSVAGAANVILTSTQGAADQSRNQNFQFTGVLTGNITVFWPQGLDRSFSVFNNTTGAFTLTVAVNNGSGSPAGATVVVPQLSTVPLASDGTNIIKTSSTVQTANGIVGDSRNSFMLNAAAGTTATFTADQLIVGTALNGSLYAIASYSQALNVATTGAGGMDTGTAPVSGFINVYAIFNPLSATASILAQDVATATPAGASPTIYSGTHLPAGYTASALISVLPTDGSSNIAPALMVGRDIAITPASVLSGGTATTYTLINIATTVPKGATKVSGHMNAGTTTSGVTPSMSLSSYTGSVAVGEINDSVTQLFGAALAALTISPFSNLLLRTAQSIYYKVAGANMLATVTLSGYSF